jgi:hypothetical protein
MRKTFAPLDDLLIERLFQPLSDLIMYRVGFGLGAVACFCIDLASLAWIVSRAGGLSGAVAGRDADNACLDLFLLVLGLVALVSLRTLFRRTRCRPGNPLRMAMRPHRGIVLLMLVARLGRFEAANLADAADVAMLLFVTSALYLGACSERPPVHRTRQACLPTG